jgi:hypothetical protein
MTTFSAAKGLVTFIAPLQSVQSYLRVKREISNEKRAILSLVRDRLAFELGRLSEQSNGTLQVIQDGNRFQLYKKRSVFARALTVVNGLDVKPDFAFFGSVKVRLRKTEHVREAWAKDCDFRTGVLQLEVKSGFPGYWGISAEILGEVKLGLDQVFGYHRPLFPSKDPPSEILSRLQSLKADVSDKFSKMGDEIILAAHVAQRLPRVRSNPKAVPAAILSPR